MKPDHKSMAYHCRIAQGLCGRCGKRKLATGTRCQPCAARDAFRAARRRLR